MALCPVFVCFSTENQERLNNKVLTVNLYDQPTHKSSPGSFGLRVQFDSTNRLLKK